LRAAAAFTNAGLAWVVLGAGASSTFWWRRCTEQSRSNKYTQLPWLSPNLISIWHSCAYFRPVPPRPKLPPRVTDASAAAKSSDHSTARMLAAAALALDKHW
jgi:hypothetical protein